MDLLSFNLLAGLLSFGVIAAIVFDIAPPSSIGSWVSLFWI